MSKEVGVVVLGVWVAILPFLGFPGTWRTPILFLSGLSLVGLGFYLRVEALARERGSRTGTPFAQNDDPRTHETQKIVS